MYMFIVNNINYYEYKYDINVIRKLNTSDMLLILT